MESVFDAYDFESTISLLIFFALVAVKGYAFVNALTWQERYYDAAGKLNKNAWCLITGLSLVAELVPTGLFLLNLIGTVATVVYLVDVRPAMQRLTRR